MTRYFIKNKKNIIGFIGNKEDCLEAADILVSFGFHHIKLEDKVREFAKFFLKLEDKEIDGIILEQIRERGYRVSKTYWINLSLSSVPENKDSVVISDMRMDDKVNIIIPYFISRSETTIPQDIEIIEKKDNFKTVLEKKFLNTEN